MKELYSNRVDLLRDIEDLERELERKKDSLREVENSIEEWENLSPTGTIKIKKKWFSFPFHPYGAANVSKKTWGDVEIIYLSPEEWMRTKRQYLGMGTGYVLERA